MKNKHNYLTETIFFQLIVDFILFYALILCIKRDLKYISINRTIDLFARDSHSSALG